MKTVDIKVVVDENMSVNMTMPTTITAEELEAILDRAKKIARTSVRTKVRALRGETRKRGPRIVPKEPAKRKKMVRVWDKASKTERQEMADKRGIDYNTLARKIYYLKTRG